MSFDASSPVKAVLRNVSKSFQDALTGTTAPKEEETAVELDPDPAIAAFMKSQQTPKLEIAEWARVLKLIDARGDDVNTVNWNDQNTEVSVQELMQIHNQENAKVALS